MDSLEHPPLVSRPSKFPLTDSTASTKLVKRWCNASTRNMNQMKIKLITLATALLLTGTTLADRAKRNQFDNWAPVHEYIASHATYVAPGTEAKLYVEANLGIETWETFGDMKKSVSKDLKGGGWPATGEVILVSTAEEVETLANLIRAATYGG